MTSIEERLLNTYLGLLGNLSKDFKLNFIEKLKNTIKKPGKSNTTFQSSFGAWVSEESAEEIIASLKASRVTNRF